MKFCCGVTLYYPLKEELERLIKYKEVFDCIYIYDNTDSHKKNENKLYFQNRDGFFYISQQENKGLSIAFNAMCEEAIHEGYDYICLFDQDSIIQKHDLNKMIDFIKKDSNNNVGVYVPEIVYLHKNSTVSNSYNEIKGNEVDWEISSGSFVNLFIYQQTEGFDNNYFIDRLDYDYCYVLRNCGYKVIKVNGIFLTQKLGEKSNGIFKNYSSHNAVRHYYIFRNRLYFYLNKIEPNILIYIKLSVLSIYHIFNIILKEDEKFKKLKMIYRGWVDYKGSQMGKLKRIKF